MKIQRLLHGWNHHEATACYICGNGRSALDAATDPASQDYIDFREDLQPIVDTAFLSQATMRDQLSCWLSLLSEAIITPC